MPLRGIDFLSDLKLRSTKIERGAAVVDCSDFSYCDWNYPHEGTQTKTRTLASRPAMDEIRAAVAGNHLRRDGRDSIFQSCLMRGRMGNVSG
jgi:hypothetical protein